MSQHVPTIDIDGTLVHLVDEDGALRAISVASRRENRRPLAVVSINLDHVHHFGASRRASQNLARLLDDDGVEWFNLIDGAPIASQARRVTGRKYAKLSGSDLIGRVLDDAARCDRTVGVVGGSPTVSEPFAARLRRQWPSVRLVGHWTPDRAVIESRAASEALARQIRDANVDILIVCLGKPRQERWIRDYGEATGAGALLAFGAVVDFLAGRVSRAPRWISSSGLEWAWRLMLEPRRLARRYLVQGPPAYLAVRRSR